MPQTPETDRIEGVLDRIDGLVAALRAHFGVPTAHEDSAANVLPRR